MNNWNGLKNKKKYYRRVTYLSREFKPKRFFCTWQGRHGRQGPKGLGLAWILQNSNRWQQRRHIANVAATVAALCAFLGSSNSEGVQKISR